MRTKHEAPLNRQPWGTTQMTAVKLALNTKLGVHIQVCGFLGKGPSTVKVMT